ncbi:AAA family ATPase [Methylobacter tundripaludum]|uniref:AAA family ATPase n=1 Tax=Methylobacter tundripaludum TaxID=173365 RepID=UPI0004DF2AAB|nr:AAA family ATPase [Methylobacter tundripaludum]
MKAHFVKTSNYNQFMTMLAAVEGQAPKEGRIINVNGEPGSGKSRAMDHVGADRNAIYIEGMPGMTVTYLRELLAHELNCSGGTMFRQQQAINKAFSDRKPMVILDEAQHGLNKKAECIEFLRRTCEQVGSVLVLVCHTSEKHRFGEHKLAHISTRISAVVEFTPATLADCIMYLGELCEVEIDAGVAQLALTQSRGRYRLLSNACRTLEDFATAMGKTALTADDVKGMMLCEDAMKALRKGSK